MVSITNTDVLVSVCWVCPVRIAPLTSRAFAFLSWRRAAFAPVTLSMPSLEKKWPLNGWYASNRDYKCLGLKQCATNEKLSIAANGLGLTAYETVTGSPFKLSTEIFIYLLLRQISNCEIDQILFITVRGFSNSFNSIIGALNVSPSMKFNYGAITCSQ